MIFKVLSLLACVAAVTAGLLPETLSESYDAHPSYNFKYSVDDSTTGDVKAQTETRDGDNVQGQYSLNEADGYKRIVDYTSDAVNGLKITVRRERLNNADVQTIVEKKIAAKPAVAPVPVKPKLVIPKSTTTTVVHHHQPTVYHHAPPTLHFLHTSPSSAVVKSAPALIATTHHHTPAIVHHSPTLVHHAPAAVVHHSSALLKTAISAPHHVAYVHYH